MKALIILPFLFAITGCTSQFALGPAAFNAPPVIPGFTAVPFGGGFIEEPNSMLQPPAPTETPEQTTLQALEEAQRTRAAIRSLAR